MLIAEQEEVFEISQISEKLLYNITLKCQSPVMANAFQDCQLTLDYDGKSLERADVFVDGSMSMHSHGLPTTPQILWSEERKAHIIKGLKFSMPGQWSLNFNVNSADNELKDKIVMAIKVK